MTYVKAAGEFDRHRCDDQRHIHTRHDWKSCPIRPCTNSASNFMVPADRSRHFGRSADQADFTRILPQCRQSVRGYFMYRGVIPLTMRRDEASVITDRGFLQLTCTQRKLSESLLGLIQLQILQQHVS
jgi:hypothetical protein